MLSLKLDGCLHLDTLLSDIIVLELRRQRELDERIGCAVRDEGRRRAPQERQTCVRTFGVEQCAARTCEQGHAGAEEEDDALGEEDVPDALEVLGGEGFDEERREPKK